VRDFALCYHDAMETSVTATAESVRLLESIRANRRVICAIMRKYGVVNPRIFGSVAQGTACPGSDVDILVDDVRSPGLFALAGLTHELESVIPAKVDVVSKNDIKPNRRALILSSKMVKLRKSSQSISRTRLSPCGWYSRIWTVLTIKPF
jgi:predicted nucleotidyltransferase